MSNTAIEEANIGLEQEHEPLAFIISAPLLPVDILDRHKTVEQIFDLLKTLSDVQASCTFALDGKWGTGKTFLLNMLELKLREYQAGEKFLVFHYNCWQYDYYEEPLIAIVSAMLDNIDEATHIIPSTVREKAQLCFSAAKEVIKGVACTFVENKIGIDAGGISQLVESAQEGVSQELHKKHEYDNLYAFHKVVENARRELSKLSNEQTLVIIVDELDRCLPQYAIKILERLHHLFSGIKNTVLILAIDKAQLTNTIGQIFGDETDHDAYLKKFIDFELKIDAGTVNENFFEKFSDYIALFDENALEPWTELNDFISVLFSQIEIRKQEHLIKKVQMIHQMLFDGQPKKDYSFLCFELLMAVLSENAGSIAVAPLRYTEHKKIGQTYREYVLSIERSISSPLRSYISEHWKYPINVCNTHLGSYPIYDGRLDIPLLLIGYSELTYGESGILSQRPDYDKYAEYINDFKLIKQMLEIIK